MSAGMREAGIDRAIVSGIGLMCRIGAFFDGETVDVDADGGHGARTACVENGHGARVAAQMFEEIGGNAVLERALLGLLHQLGIAPLSSILPIHGR